MADAGTSSLEQERVGSAEGDGSDEEDHGNKLVGKPQLVVDDDLREMAKTAPWSVSSYKPGNGVLSLRDENLDTYWQSDGAQPHLVKIEFQRKVKFQEIKAVELSIYLSGTDPRETFIRMFRLQIAVLSNHLNGWDTQVRLIEVYGPRPNPLPQQPFQFIVQGSS